MVKTAEIPVAAVKSLSNWFAHTYPFADLPTHPHMHIRYTQINEHTQIRGRITIKKFKLTKKGGKVQRSWKWFMVVIYSLGQIVN